jgi:hypothetical protein
LSASAVEGDVGQGLPPARSCLGGLPHLQIGGAEIAEDHALDVPVAGFAHDRYRLLVAADGFLKPVHFPIGVAEVVQGHALAMLVADLLADRDVLLEAVDGLLEPRSPS